MFSFAFGALEKVVAVVEFAGLVPAVLAGAPGVLVVAGDAAALFLGGKETIDLIF
jgi:hypothetical protein